MDMLSEDYETVSLAEILSLRDAYLSEEELWALCRESCLTLEYVRDSQDLFQGLCITPESVAFDQSGSVCFLDLDEDPDPLYIAPEIEDVDNSFKTHLFSLGMTMLYGIEYNVQADEPKHDLSTELSNLLTSLCTDIPSERPTIEQVIQLCDDILQDKSSQSLCSSMIDSCIRGNTSDSGRSSILDLSAGLKSFLNNQSPHTPRQSTPQDSLVTEPHDSPSTETLDSPATETQDHLQSTPKDEFESKYSATNNDLNSNASSERNSIETVIENKNKKLLESIDKCNKHDEDDICDAKRYNELCDANCDKELESLGVDILELNNSQSNNSDLNDSTCDKVKDTTPTASKTSNNKETRYSSNIYTGEMECLDLSSILEITRDRFDSLDVWCLLTEGILAIRKKRRHFPAFISPDTTVIKENGSIIFTTTPDGQKLETKYMAPELQKKGIVSEKTCLYGLAMTLQCISSTEELDEALQDLLLSMLHSNSDKRPGVTQSLDICDQLQPLFEITSREGCRILLHRAWNYYSDDEDEDDDDTTDGRSQDTSLHKFEVLDNSKDRIHEENKLAGKNSSAPTPVSAFKPIHPETNVKPVVIGSQSSTIVKPVVIGSRSSAFKPVPLKARNLPKPQPVYNETSSPVDSHKDDCKRTVSASSDQDLEKAPQVMQKLKDLEQRLSRHRSVDESKTAEVNRSVPTEVNNNIIPIDKINKSIDFKTESDAKSPDALSVLLKKFDGQLPDTDTLATAIAQYLQTQINSNQSKDSEGKVLQFNDGGGKVSSQSNDSVKVLSKPDKIVSTQPQELTNDYDYVKTFNMPVQSSAGGQFAPYPIQLQLQQDPKTGFVQLVPVGMVPLNTVMSQPQNINTVESKNIVENSVRAGSDISVMPGGRSNARNAGFSSRAESGVRSGIRDSAHHILDDTKPIGASPPNFQDVHVEGKPPMPSRSAKQLVKKTVYSRTKNKSHGYSSDSGILERSNQPDESPFNFPPTNARAQIQTLQTELEQSFNSQASWDAHNKSERTFLSENGYFNQSQNGYRSHHVSGSRSANTSPSWSKDSGVSGLQYGDKSLMERLLSQDNLNHQRVLGQVLGVLRESGILENKDLDDFGVAEYVTSLGNLRIDTFSGAVSEKYHQINWPHQLLYSLYSIINNNGSRSKSQASRCSNKSENQHTRRQSVPTNIQGPSCKTSPEHCVDDRSPTDLSSPNSNISPLSQTNLEPMQDRHFRSSSLYRRTSGISETSDSTDTERHEKRRKFKKRYQLDRSKSSSMTNLILHSNASPQSNGREHNNSFMDSTAKAMNRSLTTTSLSTHQNQNGGSKTSSPGSVSNYLEQDYLSLAHPNYETVTLEDHAYEPFFKSKSNSLENSQKSESLVGQFSIQHRGLENTKSIFRPDDYITDHLQEKQSPDKYYSVDELSSASVSTISKSSHPSLPKFHKLPSNSQTMVPKRYASKTSSDSESSSRSEKQPLKARHDIVRSVNSDSRSKAVRTMSSVPEQKEFNIKRKAHVIYHWASVCQDFAAELETFSSQINEDDRLCIERHLVAVQQQLTMERKMRRKSQRFYQKLIDPNQTSRGEQKSVVNQVLKDLEDMTRKVQLLQLCKTHLQMLLDEFNGVHQTYTFSLTNILNDRIVLQSHPDNPLLQFQLMLDPQSNGQIEVLQAGEPKSLLAYLFITCAISNGFIHQFLYSYRYFISSDNLLDYILNVYTAALRSDRTDVRMMKIKQRALDILYYWVEGFYDIDFDVNKTLLFRLEQFLMTQLSHNDDSRDTITDLLQLCSYGNQISQSNTSVDNKDEDEPTLFLKLDSPKKWNSFKNLTKRSPAKRVQSFKDLTTITKAGTSDRDDGFYPKLTKRNDTFTLLDYSPQCLVEQLTLITQELFQSTHPIQYLNSKANGIGVALSLPGLRTPSMIRKRDSGESQSLFLTTWLPCTIIDELINLAQNISQWVAAEIVSCSNPKAQAQLLTKFISVAQISEEIHNYSTCLAVIEGLENVIVRQLPIWKTISSKYITVMEGLSTMKMKLKSEPFYLIKDKNYMMNPTIPDILYFLLHVQQMEMGSFTLANGLIKWTKMRTISQLIDQIRIFRANEYGFEPNYDFQDNLVYRMEEYLLLDIQSIASQNDNNFRRMSGGGLHNVLRKVKDKLGKT